MDELENKKLKEMAKRARRTAETLFRTFEQLQEECGEKDKEPEMTWPLWLAAQGAFLQLLAEDKGVTVESLAWSLKSYLEAVHAVWAAARDADMNGLTDEMELN